MSLQLDDIPARQLARELVTRVPTILRGQLARAFRHAPKSAPASAGAGGARFDRTVFATFTRKDGVSMPLWGGYRNRIKARWRQGFWLVRVLLHLDQEIVLPHELRELARTIRDARTLPLALQDLYTLIHPVVLEHPNLVQPTGRHDSFVGATELAIAPVREQIRERVAYHLRNARRLLAHCQQHSRVPASGLRTLEQGCGAGHTTMALAALGVGEAVGIDIDFERHRDVESEMMRQEFLRADRRAAVARLRVGDATALPFPDGSFDIVHSTSVVEHIARPDLALREAHRVLKPGGIAYFDVDPWFSPQGGHGLCTLDCPWGHVRLEASEFERYLADYRPHEIRQAAEFYQRGFQSPRLTIAQIEAIIVESSFHILEWHESRQTYGDHYELITPELLADCQRLNPLVTVRDLMSSSYVMLLAKP